MNSQILREKFLDFFKSKGHKIMPSDSLVPKDDPTVLFTPAGMNQFKSQFLAKKPTLKRVATCQKCLRTDDLDKVGKTPWHHTFFEMLGNFSFGDYFKKEAIVWAWEFLTEVLKIDKDRLWVSVYIEDEESFNIWKEIIKIDPAKIVKLDDKYNFWPAEVRIKGPDGPCGPCSEVFFDRGKNFGCGRETCQPGCGCDRFVEVWNLVFTQFNRRSDGVLEPLPKKNIDTGMGLERLASVMQKVNTNFETDLFMPIVEEILSKVSREKQNFKEDIYAISDHIRAISFAIADGVIPSNEERGYIVRKLIRKSILHLKRLGIEKAFLYRLVPIVAEVLGSNYPEIKQRRENISEIILTEEKNYFSILNASRTIFKDKFKDFLEGKTDEIEAGRIAFQVYDTYGIPFELIQDFAVENNFKISKEEFEKQLELQRARSQALSKIEKNIFILPEELNLRSTKFLGYDLFETKAKVLKVIPKDNFYEVILDRTVFYPESGGQIGDTGIIKKGKTTFEVLDTQKKDNIIIHQGVFKGNIFKKNDTVSAQIDIARRLAIARNHTATHILQAVLRKVLGKHVQQQGSYVGVDYLRFDFSHFKPLSFEEIKRIEDLVNEYIIENTPVIKKELSLSQAKKIGALAFFKEKYGKKVRVVFIGDYSKELCGGTHLDSTSQIGIFKITSFSSVAQGIKRIEAVTGKSAYKKIAEDERLIKEVANLLNSSPQNILIQLKKKIEESKVLKKRVDNLQFESIKASLDELFSSAEKIDQIKIIFKVFKDISLEVIRDITDLIKKRDLSVISLLITILEGKAFMVMGIGDELVKKGLDASIMIKEIAGLICGSGGGRKDFAQGSGTGIDKLESVYLKLKELLKK